ncbi:MAG: O-6-methylguanine DNA methyltransferase [Candidatus Paceibacteria bacterium]|jgi:O-6-methylguanine DNA methyltransferase
MKTFTEKVIAVVKKIPKGMTMNYTEVAKQAGSKGASRAVGSIMTKNQNTSVPCHRVIRSDGTIGPYNGLQGQSKEALLRREGAIK